MTLLQEHIQTGQSLIEQADTAYAKGDFEKAVEKAWEATYLAMRPIAERRAWKFDTPGDMYSVANRLSKETDRRDIYILYQVAFILPHNFREGWLSDDDIKHDIQDVKQLLSILQNIE